jgi:hypothetical protein
MNKFLGMKNIRFIIWFVISVFLSNSIIAQKPLHNDTIICIVNTNHSYTQLEENPYKKNPGYHWRVFIKGNYYKNTRHAEDAGVNFVTDFRGNSWVKEPFVILIPFKGMEKRFTVVTDSWINEQDDLQVLHGLIGFAPGINYNYVVFEQDILQNNNGYVNAYRVLVGYNEVQY